MSPQALTRPRDRVNLKLGESFWLGFVFGPSGETATQLRRMVEQIGRARDNERGRQPGTSGVMLMRPRKPDELRHLLIPLFDERTASAWCMWVDVMDIEHTGTNQDEAAPTDPWAEAWSWLMLRTNERRDRLRRHLNGGLVFAVRNEWKPLVRNAAPDLWSVRSIVIETPNSPWRKSRAGLVLARSNPYTEDPWQWARDRRRDRGHRCG